MTGLTARNFGIAERGALKTGHHADIVIFDAGAFRDTADYAAPKRQVEGIDAVIVNGEITWQSGVHTDARAGHVITPNAPRGAI